jgi:lambda repressor-like predicted transcriptional regulator
MKQTKTRSIILVSGLVVLLLAAFASVALAQGSIGEAGAPLFHGGFGRGFGGFGEGREDRDAALAAALGITVEELQAARQKVFTDAISAAVEAGELTQEQADQMLAMHALRSYIDRGSLLAEALGMTVEELEAAFAEGQTLADLMTEKGLTAATLQANLQAAHQAAIARAVADGVITQEQADAILSGQGFGFGFGHHGGMGGHHGGFGGFGGFGNGSLLPTAPRTGSGQGA